MKVLLELESLLDNTVVSLQSDDSIWALIHKNKRHKNFVFNITNIFCKASC